MSKWGGAQQPKPTRIRLTPQPICGRVQQWKGSYGWIEPQCVVEHPDIAKHKGRIFVHAEDTTPKWKNLTVGSLVEFYLYHDGQGLGAEDCTARKVLRMTLTWQGAQAAFGPNGEGLPEFELRNHVTLRAYQWMTADGSNSDLSFLLFEVWGRPDNVIEAALQVAERERRVVVELLVPESRLWKVNMQDIQRFCRKSNLSQDLAISEPMPCRTMTLKGSREECGGALQTLMTQICD